MNGIQFTRHKTNCVMLESFRSNRNRRNCDPLGTACCLLLKLGIFKDIASSYKGICARFMTVREKQNLVSEIAIENRKLEGGGVTTHFLGKQ